MGEQSQNVFGRAWAGWTRFWFEPADPTPLCFMRIVVGILTLYVHLAYCFDLVDFFGPNAWFSQREANENRRTTPHMVIQRTWEQPQIPFRMPEDLRLRRVLKTFIDRVIAQPDPDRTIAFLASIGFAGDERDPVLQYLKQLPSDPAERAAELKPFVEEKLSDEDKSKLPRYFLRQVTPESRKFFAEELAHFHDLLPGSAADRIAMLNMLMESNSDSWGALQDFIRKMRKLTPEQREEELEFQAIWRIPSEYVHAKGWHVYSPWFHVTDVRLLRALHGLHLVIIVLFMLGVYTRVTCVMTWLIGLTYINRAQVYLFGQDTMMNLCLLYLMLSPCGAKWSWDRWTARRRAAAEGKTLPPVQPSVSARFALRLFQVQYALMYLSAGLAKLKGPSWWDGTAFFTCLNNPEFTPMHIEAYRNFLYWMCSNSNRMIWEIIMTGSAAFTIVTEVSFPWLIWTPMRPVLLAAAMVLHTGIAILMGLSVFSLFMFALLICYFPADAINWMFESKPAT